MKLVGRGECLGEMYVRWDKQVPAPPAWRIVAVAFVNGCAVELTEEMNRNCYMDIKRFWPPESGGGR